MRERVVLLGFLIILNLIDIRTGRSISTKEIEHYRQRVVSMFHHAYDGYIQHAYPYDELRPLTCDGQDTWGSFSLTLIDALDTLAIMGNYSEFRRVADLVIDKMNFDIDINASVFETNIRILGGLLSAHLFTKQAGMDLEPGWPCNGPLLRLAEDVARRILPAFDTPTGMPYGTINLRHGVPKGETTVTCTAGVGTFIVEFGTLSRLTGDPVFEKVAMRAIRALWDSRSELGLVGNHIDVSNGKWTALDSGIGGGIDSYFEYLVKGAIMFDIPELLQMFQEYVVTIEKHTKRDDWYMWAHMKKGGITLPMFTSLDAYWPGIQSLLGEIDKAMKTMHNYHQVWKQFGFLPEYYNIPKNEAHAGREGYPLRPELLESALYLYRATKDPFLLDIGIDAIEAIEHSAKTKCGYATIKDVNTHKLDNRMESFFLAETTKYLYLLFEPDNFILNNGSRGTVIDTPNGECVIDAGGYFFNTEAHPIDVACVYCCSNQKTEDDRIIREMHDNLDLLALLDITEPDHAIKGKKLKQETRKRRVDRLEDLQVLDMVPQSDLLGVPSRNENKGDTLLHELKDRIFQLKAVLEEKIQQSNLSGNAVFSNISKNIDELLNASESESTKTGNEEEKDEIYEIEKDKTNEESGPLPPESITAEEEIKGIKKDINNQKHSEADSPDLKNEESSQKIKIDRDTVSLKQEIKGENPFESDKSDTEIPEKAEDRTLKDSVDSAGAPSDIKEADKEIENEERDKVITTKAEPSVQTVYIHPKTTETKQDDTQKSTTSKPSNQQALTNLERVFNLLLGNPEPKTEPASSSPNIQHLYRTMQIYPLLHVARPELMMCKAQPFHMRFSVSGEFFDDDE